MSILTSYEYSIPINKVIICSSYINQVHFIQIMCLRKNTHILIHLKATGFTQYKSNSSPNKINNCKFLFISKMDNCYPHFNKINFSNPT